MRRISLLLCAVFALAQGAEPITPGHKVPTLTVQSLDGTETTLEALRGKRPLVLMVWCSTCESCRGMEARFDALAKECGERVAVYGLGSNPNETAEKVRARQLGSKVSFPVVIDRDGAGAAAFGVTCTTTALVIAPDGTLAYKGLFEGNGKQYAREALRAVLAGKTPTTRETAQSGCPIR